MALCGTTRLQIDLPRTCMLNMFLLSGGSLLSQTEPPLLHCAFCMRISIVSACAQQPLHCILSIRIKDKEKRSTLANLCHSNGCILPFKLCHLIKSREWQVLSSAKMTLYFFRASLCALESERLVLEWLESCWSVRGGPCRSKFGCRRSY